MSIESTPMASSSGGAVAGEGVVLRFDKRWEGAFGGCATVLRDGPRLRLYHRGLPASILDGSAAGVPGGR